MKIQSPMLRDSLFLLAVVLALAASRAGAQTKPEKRGSQELSLQSGQAGEVVFFEVVKNSGELVRVLVRDPGGVGIEFHFTNWQVDPPVDDSLFHFRAPSGVAIVNGELPTVNGGISP